MGSPNLQMERIEDPVCNDVQNGLADVCTDLHEIRKLKISNSLPYRWLIIFIFHSRCLLRSPDDISAKMCTRKTFLLSQRRISSAGFSLTEQYVNYVKIKHAHQSKAVQSPDLKNSVGMTHKPRLGDVIKIQRCKCGWSRALLPEPIMLQTQHRFDKSDKV